MAHSPLDSAIQEQLLKKEGTPVPEDYARTFAPARIWIREWQDYWLFLPGVDQLRVGPVELLPKHDGLFLLRFENHVGLARIVPVTGARLAGAGVAVEVISPKFSALSNHLDFFRNLLVDLFQRSVRMPFSIQALTQRGVQEAIQPPTPLFTYHFLCQHAAEITAAVEIILASPHRLLVDEDTLVPLGAARSVDADVVLDIFRDTSRWVKAGSHPLSAKLGGYVPDRVRQHLPDESFDTPENRFVRNFLLALLGAIDDLVFQRWWGRVPAARRERLQELRSLLQQTIAHPVFEEVGEQHMLPLNSQVLLRRDGYRELLSLWQQFHQARRPLFQPLQHAIDVRNIAELYEYWCFFALADRIGDALGVNPRFELRTSDVHGLDWSSQVIFDKQGRLLFNRSFTPGGSAFSSYSTSMRPDFTWVAAGKAKLVFDAKFSFSIAEWGEEEAGAGHQAMKLPSLENLYKMHTYRDALGLDAAVIIYPGDRDVFFDPRAKPHRVGGFTLAQLLLGELSGIGALAMQPGA